MKKIIAIAFCIFPSIILAEVLFEELQKETTTTKQHLMDLSKQLQKKRNKIPEIKKIKSLQQQINNTKDKVQKEYALQLDNLEQQIKQAAGSIESSVSNYTDQIMKLSKNSKKNEKEIEAIQKKITQLQKTAKSADGTTLESLIKKKKIIEQKIQDAVEKQTQPLENQIKELSIESYKKQKKDPTIISIGKELQKSHKKLLDLEKNKALLIQKK